ncbi:DUF2332 domain-containing protein [Phenylobacterium sp.]|jgi:hypothetical protein|uniref:DUF2332 domain-containing protein n=1 Tax=Phenylobacterium sp. TaxID=1871053 RepID=UPI002E330E42|nr:DUF2332 family protein [Phenylobacterium sp.]HEX2559782.1 DUF2332 family protein [Phenylobacterium sp.]
MVTPISPALISAFDSQAGFCERLGSPFNAALASTAAGAMRQGDDLEGLLRPWAGLTLQEIGEAAVTLRLLGACHDLALSGEAPELAAAYPAPERGGDPKAAWSIARTEMAARRDRFEAFLGHEPQTNEVRRSAVLLPGFLAIAQATGLPLRCFELGASAGLNLNWDGFRYRLGDFAWGPEDSDVQLAAEWRGPPPPLGAPIRVLERSACDRRPVDLTDPAQRRRLLAFIWPDQFERLAAARAAIDLALSRGVQVEAADAAEWPAGRAEAAAGAATVLYHSIFWQYLPEASRARLATLIETLGRAATPEAPFAWLRMEPPPGDLAQIELRLTLWPGGEDRRLARVHPHGAWLEWDG